MKKQQQLLQALLLLGLAAGDELLYGARFGPKGTPVSFLTGRCHPTEAPSARLPTIEEQQEKICSHLPDEFTFKKAGKDKCQCVAPADECPAPQCLDKKYPLNEKTGKCEWQEKLANPNAKLKEPVCPEGWTSVEEAGSRFFCFKLEDAPKLVPPEKVCPPGTSGPDCTVSACRGKVPEPTVYGDSQKKFVGAADAPWSFGAMGGDCKCKNDKIEVCKEGQGQDGSTTPIERNGKKWCWDGDFVPCKSPGPGGVFYQLQEVPGFMALVETHVTSADDTQPMTGKTFKGGKPAVYFDKAKQASGKHLCKVEVTASKKLAKDQAKPSVIEWEHADANGPTDSLVVAYEMKNKQLYRTHYKDKECESPCQMGPGGKCWAPCPSGTHPTSPFGSCEAPAVCPMEIPIDALACGPSTGFYIDFMFEQLKLIRPVDADNSNSREIAADAAAVFALTMEHAQDCFVTTNCIKKPDFSVHKKTCDMLTWPGAFKDGYCVDHLGGTLSESQCNKKKFTTDGMCKFDGLPNGCSNNVNQGKWFVFSAKAFNQVHNGKIVNALPLANVAGFFIDPNKLTAKFASGAGKAPVLDCRQSYCMKLSGAMSLKNSASAFCDNDKCRKVVDEYWPRYSSALHKRNKGLNPGMCDAMAED